MYLIPSMIELGLKEGETFKSSAHMKVAQNYVIGNPNINTVDQMRYIVQCIQKIPMNRIKKITFKQFEDEFLGKD